MFIQLNEATNNTLHISNHGELGTFIPLWKLWLHHDVFIIIYTCKVSYRRDGFPLLHLRPNLFQTLATRLLGPSRSNFRGPTFPGILNTELSPSQTNLIYSIEVLFEL